MSTRSPNQPELDQNLVQIPGMVDEISRSAVSTEDTLKIQPASGMEVRSTLCMVGFETQLPSAGCLLPRFAVLSDPEAFKKHTQRFEPGPQTSSPYFLKN